LGDTIEYEQDGVLLGLKAGGLLVYLEVGDTMGKGGNGTLEEGYEVGPKYFSKHLFFLSLNSF